MNELEAVGAKLEHLEKTVDSLEKAILEIRVALLGGLDGRPGLLAQMSNYRNDLQHTRNDIRFCDNKIAQQQDIINGLQKESWIRQGKLVGSGGLLGLFLTKLLDFFLK